MKVNNTVDYTEYGEGWVNTILDLKLAVRNCPKTYPYSIFYFWSITKEGEPPVVGLDADGEDATGIVCAFYQAFKNKKELIPLVLAAISKYIEDEPDKDIKKSYQDATLTILNFND